MESLLELSQVSTRPPKLAPVDLNRIVAEVISDLESRLESTGGRVEVCGGLLPTLCGDPNPLRQLLQNLIGNALKFRRSETPSVVTVRGDIFSSADPDHSRRMGTPDRCRQRDWVRARICPPDFRGVRAFGRPGPLRRQRGWACDLPPYRRASRRHHHGLRHSRRRRDLYGPDSPWPLDRGFLVF